MEIGLYFGSFNPIHTGHLIIAEYVVAHTAMQQVWLVVSPQNPFKPSSSLLNEYDRLYLVNVAIEDNEHIMSCDVEFRLPKPSYTIDTLTYLSEKYPQHQFTVIMGSDSFQNIAKWKNSEVLLKHYNIIVYQRPNSIIDEHQVPKNVQVLHAPMIDISATHIRKEIKAQHSVRYLITEPVRKEIERHGFYQ